MKITIVTVCPNAQDTFGRTIETCCRQDHADKELLVVDGASTHATLRVVRALDRPEITLVSEPDRGLYDAMNKGLGRFCGEAVGFLNADEGLADEGALSAIADALERWRLSPWLDAGPPQLLLPPRGDRGGRPLPPALQRGERLRFHAADNGADRLSGRAGGSGVGRYAETAARAPPA